MKIGRLVKTAIKVAPVAYPLIRKAMNKKKKKGKTDDTSQYKTRQTRR